MKPETPASTTVRLVGALDERYHRIGAIAAPLLLEALVALSRQVQHQEGRIMAMELALAHIVADEDGGRG